MIVSTKGRYALRVMVCLAQRSGGEYVPLKEIAESENMSQKYLESIMTTLSKAGFVDEEILMLRSTTDRGELEELLDLPFPPVPVGDIEHKCQKRHGCFRYCQQVMSLQQCGGAESRHNQKIYTCSRPEQSSQLSVHLSSPP